MRVYPDSERNHEDILKKKFRDGFSMVEMLIAVAVSAVVLSSLIALLSYTLRSTNQTQARISLQNEAKDVVNHMASYVMEGNHATWEDASGRLAIEKDMEQDEVDSSTGAVVTKLKKKEMYYYYLLNGALYFKNVSGGDTSLTEDKKHLLCENVESFEAKPDDADKQTIHITVKLKNSVSEFECKQDVHIRNKCKGGGKHDS